MRILLLLSRRCFLFLFFIYSSTIVHQVHCFAPKAQATKTTPKKYKYSTFLTPREHHRQRFSSLFANKNDEYDLVVVGGGVVGFEAAIAGASSPNNKKVCLVDAPRASGMLMNEETGEDLSIGAPTGLFSKALRDVSKKINVSGLRGLGLREESLWNEIISTCVDLATSNAQDVRRQMEAAGVDYIEGLASFPDDGSTNSLIVSRGNLVECVRAKNILLSTGSQPFRPAGIPFDGQRVFDSDSINQINYLPRSIAITGSGIIAIEYAKIFSNLGADVTLIIRDNLPRNALMKIGLDRNVAATLVADLVNCGIKFIRGAQAKEFVVPDNKDAPIRILLEAKGGGKLRKGSQTEVKCDIYLAAVGRKPNTGSLNLIQAGIEVDRYGGILVNDRLVTTAKQGNVYAAGDVLGRPFLASTGSAQGKAAITEMFSKENWTSLLKSDPGDQTCVLDPIGAVGESFCPASLAKNPFAFPIGVWSSPEAAYYGLSLQQAKEMGIQNTGEAIALYAECLRGRVFSPNGVLKLVFEKPAGRILGVHICGDDACELIHYGMELIKGRRTIEDINNSLYSAVTYHELYSIAAKAAMDEDSARKRRAAASQSVAQRIRDAKNKDNFF